MKKLLKDYGFKSDMSYYEMIVESFINGQRTQAVDQFKALPKKNRVSMLHMATVGSWESGMSFDHKTALFYSFCN